MGCDLKYFSKIPFHLWETSAQNIYLNYINHLNMSNPLIYYTILFDLKIEIWVHTSQFQ